MWGCPQAMRREQKLLKHTNGEAEAVLASLGRTETPAQPPLLSAPPHLSCLRPWAQALSSCIKPCFLHVPRNRWVVPLAVFQLHPSSHLPCRGHCDPSRPAALELPAVRAWQYPVHPTMSSHQPRGEEPSSQLIQPSSTRPSFPLCPQVSTHPWSSGVSSARHKELRRGGGEGSSALRRGRQQADGSRSLLRS